MKNKNLSTDDINLLILIASIIFGAMFRFIPTTLASFPINDGGMFASMINDLQVNHFIPPLYTSYNNLHIPFAYPPLAFYIGAILKSIFNISEIEILRWLPALLNTLCIPIFYFLAKEILNNKTKGAIATFAFALTPHLNTWLSAGGGLTRNFGVIFLIVTLLFSWKLFVKNETKAIWGLIFSGSLVILSHTESTVFAISLPILIWAVKSRTIKTAMQALGVAFGVILIAGPWYGFVISHHGINPLLSALQTGSQSFWSVLRLINVDIITEEPYLDVLGVIGILGIIFLISKKDYFIPIMLATIYLIQPRSAHTVGNIPLAMASGVFIVDALMPIFHSSSITLNRGNRVLVSILIPYILVNSIYHSYMLSQHHVSTNEQNTMQWVAKNTPENSNFLIITNETDPMCDSTSEWFPYLTKRTNLTTLQGREWLSDKNFNEFIGQRNMLQTCQDLECLNKSIKYFGTPDYIYLSLNSPTNLCQSSNATNKSPSISSVLENSSFYIQVFKSPDAMIFSSR